MDLVVEARSAAVSVLQAISAALAVFAIVVNVAVIVMRRRRPRVTIVGTRYYDGEYDVERGRR